MDEKPDKITIAIGEFKYDKSWYSLSEKAQDKVNAFVKGIRLSPELTAISDEEILVLLTEIASLNQNIWTDETIKALSERAEKLLVAPS